MVAGIQEVLNDLGWNDGFRIPIANAENKRLEEEVERKNRLRTSLKSQLENTLERIKDIRKHAADIRQEQIQNQRLLGAHSAQVEAEKRLCLTAQAEKRRLLQQTKESEREVSETSEKIEGLQQTVDRLTKKLQASKKSIQADTHALIEWEERLNKKEEKNIIIEQFVKSDEKTFKEKELERQNLSEKAELFRQSMIKIVGDVQELETTLDRTARLYNQGIKDRRELMDQWSKSVNVLNERDKSIYDALQQINSLRDIAKERLDAFQEAERFLNIQESENKEVEYSTKTLERSLMQDRQEHQKLLESIDSFSLEVHLQQKLLQDLARRIEDTRTNIKRKRNANENKKTKLAEMNRIVSGLKETLKNIDGQTLNAEDRLNKMRDMLEKEEKRRADITKAIEVQQNLIVLCANRMSNLEGEYKIIELRSQAETKRSEQYEIDFVKMQKLLTDKKEDNYQIDIQLQKGEMRYQNVLGQGMTKEEIEAKQKRLKDLQSMQKENLESMKSLQAQLSIVANDIRTITVSITSSKEELVRLRDKQQELLVSIEGGEKQLRLAQSKYEDRMVDENILELRIKQTEKLAFKFDDKLYDLEKYAYHMDTAMQERRAEIKVEKENLTLEKRLIVGDCAEIRNTITERKSRIQQLQGRYELAMAILGTNPEDGTPMTTAYLMIQMDQERYLLQQKGDRLDQLIRKAEQEIRSMENTLKLVTFCNDKFKSNLSMVENNEPEKVEQRRLDNEMFNVLEVLNRKRERLDAVREDYKRIEENCEKLEKSIELIKEEKEAKRQLISNLELQINDQMSKIYRTDKILRKILNEIQSKCICLDEVDILMGERDIAVRDLQDQNNLALQYIAEFTIRHLEAEVYVKKLLEKFDIEFPSSYCMKQYHQPAATPLSTSRSASRSSSSSSKSISRSECSMSSRSSRSFCAGLMDRKTVSVAKSSLEFDPDCPGPKKRTTAQCAKTVQKQCD